MRQANPAFGGTHTPAAIAQALGVPVEDLDPAYPIQTVPTGMAFCIVPLVSVAALQRLAINQSTASSLDAKIVDVFVDGRTIPVASGTFLLP